MCNKNTNEKKIKGRNMEFIWNVYRTKKVFFSNRDVWIIWIESNLRNSKSNKFDILNNQWFDFESIAYFICFI